MSLDNGTIGVIQTEVEVGDMEYVIVFAHGTQQTYIVREGRIPASFFTTAHERAETMDGRPVRLVRDPSLDTFRVIFSV